METFIIRREKSRFSGELLTAFLRNGSPIVCAGWANAFGIGEVSRVELSAKPLKGGVLLIVDETGKHANIPGSFHGSTYRLKRTLQRLGLWRAASTVGVWVRFVNLKAKKR